MLYNTHKRYGQVAGILMVPVAATVGVMDFDIVKEVSLTTVNESMLNIVVLISYLFVALKASMFGAEFPDLDSPGSTPSKNHKILAYLFKSFKIKHRGKFSHDVISQSILWGVIYGLVITFGNSLGTSELALYLVSVTKVFVLFSYVGVLSHLIADAMTVEGVWFAWKFKVKFMPVFIKKVGIGKFKPFKNWFTTSSIWNDINYKGMTAMIPVSALISFLLVSNIL